MFKRLANWVFESNLEAASESLSSPQKLEDQVTPETLSHADELKRVREQFSYPPREKGISFESPELLVETHSSLIGQLRRFAAVGNDFDRLYMDAIHRYAKVVHLLPASESHHHRLMGGLLHHGIHAGLIAYRLSEDVDFSSNHSSLELRRLQEPKYRFACFLAALCHDLGKVVSDIEVHNHDATLRWIPYSGSLTEWGAENTLDKYFVSWLPTRKNNRHIRFNSSIAPLVISPAAMAYLSEFGPEVQSDLMAALSGDATSPIYRISAKADSISVAEDLREHKIMTGHMSVGISLAEHIVSKLSQLIRQNDIPLKPSEKLVFNIDDAIYLAWPTVAERIIAGLKEDGIQGIPSRAEVIADVLLDHGLAERPDSKGRYYYVSEENKSRATKEYSTLKLTDPETVFTSALPPVVPKPHKVFDLPSTSRRLSEQLQAAKGDQAEVAEGSNSSETNEAQPKQPPSTVDPAPVEISRPVESVAPEATPSPEQKGSAAVKKPKGLKQLGEHGQIIFVAIRSLLDDGKKPTLEGGVVYLPWEEVVDASGLDKQECKELLTEAKGFLKEQIPGNPNSIFKIMGETKYIGLSDSSKKAVSIDFPTLACGTQSTEEPPKSKQSDAKPSETKIATESPLTKVDEKSKASQAFKKAEKDRRETQEVTGHEIPKDVLNSVVAVTNEEAIKVLLPELAGIQKTPTQDGYVALTAEEYKVVTSAFENSVKTATLKNKDQALMTIIKDSKMWRGLMIWRLNEAA